MAVPHRPSPAASLTDSVVIRDGISSRRVAARAAGRGGAPCRGGWRGLLCGEAQGTYLGLPWGLKSEGVPPCSQKSQGLFGYLPRSATALSLWAEALMGMGALQPLPNHRARWLRRPHKDTGGTPWRKMENTPSLCPSPQLGGRPPGRPRGARADSPLPTAAPPSKHLVRWSAAGLVARQPRGLPGNEGRSLTPALLGACGCPSLRGAG